MNSLAEQEVVIVKRDYYDVLGVNKHADEKEIKHTGNWRKNIIQIQMQVMQMLSRSSKK